VRIDKFAKEGGGGGYEQVKLRKKACGLFYDVDSIYTMQRQTVELLIDDELEKIQKEVLLA
jgi:hypothetical protein